MILLAAFQAVLARTAGEPEVTVGCPVSSRALDHLEAEHRPLLWMNVCSVT
ncbi:MAG TPA: hypothetical protein VFE33_12085 [Thermoanaerobaculia bacterium]|nr:hypothetical protein [Thermoanaerobaculia bacterium]